VGLMNVVLYGLGGLAMVLVVLFVVWLIMRQIVRRHRVLPNQVMVIYGRGKTTFSEEGVLDRSGVRLITGGGTWVFPFWKEYDFLDLTIAKAKDEVYTVDGVPIRLDWVAQMQINSSESSLLTAARAFLGMPRDEVKSVIAQTLSANFRAIVGQMTVEGVHRDRDAFVGTVRNLAKDDMEAMGVTVISMGIEEITDDQGYFEAMAKPVIAAVKRDALIAEAEADREARIKAAGARREAQQAELDADRASIEQR
jgi:flotillin